MAALVAVAVAVVVVVYSGGGGSGGMSVGQGLKQCARFEGDKATSDSRWASLGDALRKISRVPLDYTSAGCTVSNDDGSVGES